MNSSSISGFSSGGAGDVSSGEFAANETEMRFFLRCSLTAFLWFPVPGEKPGGRSDVAVNFREAIIVLFDFLALWLSVL
jgi:hypothetical protein